MLKHTQSVRLAMKFDQWPVSLTTTLIVYYENEKNENKKNTTLLAAYQHIYNFSVQTAKCKMILACKRDHRLYSHSEVLSNVPKSKHIQNAFGVRIFSSDVIVLKYCFASQNERLQRNVFLNASIMFS